MVKDRSGVGAERVRVVFVARLIGGVVAAAVDCVCGYQSGAVAASEEIRNDPPDASRLLQFRRAGAELGILLSFRREERAPYIDGFGIVGAEAGAGGVEGEARRGRSLEWVG